MESGEEGIINKPKAKRQCVIDSSSESEDEAHTPPLPPPTKKTKGPKSSALKAFNAQFEYEQNLALLTAEGISLDKAKKLAESFGVVEPTPPQGTVTLKLTYEQYKRFRSIEVE